MRIFLAGLVVSCCYMKADRGLAKLSTLALENRRRGLAINLPRAEQTLAGSLLERYVTCGKPDSKCARGERHGPSWYLTVTLANKCGSG